MTIGKPNALVYVHRNGLIVAGKHIKHARLSFPSEVMANMEIIDANKFVSLCQKFFEEHELQRKRVLVVLDNDLVFSKKIDLGTTGKPDVLIETFIAAMPFEQGQRACMAIESKKSLRLLATNAQLYQSISEALRLCGISKLFSITPAAAYDLQGVEHKVSTLVEHFLKNTGNAKAANFVSTDIL